MSLCQSSVEGENVVNLKETELLNLVIKLLKSFAVPKACTR